MEDRDLSYMAFKTGFKSCRNVIIAHLAKELKEVDRKRFDQIVSSLTDYTEAQLKLDLKVLTARIEKG